MYVICKSKSRHHSLSLILGCEKDHLFPNNRGDTCLSQTCCSSLPLSFAPTLGLGYEAGQNLSGTKESKEGDCPASFPCGLEIPCHFEEQRDKMRHKWSLNEMFDVLVIMTVGFSSLIGCSSKFLESS